jgi:hypothetical protein
MASLLSLDRPALIGSEEPRLWTPPLRELTPETSLGFEVVDFARDILGIELFPWQQWLFIHGLELRTDRSYRFRTILTLVARQNGKTTALNVLTLWRMIMDGARVVIGSSTNLDYARKSWLATVEMAKGSPAVVDEFRWPETRANGRESLETRDGAFYGIATASRKGGRSLSVDLLILDEIREHRTWEAWSASSKTTNARSRGQRWAISNMGDDSSVVLNHLQSRALENVDPSLAIFEWSGHPGCDTADRSEWPWANPALGYTITEDVIASDLSTDSEEVFRTEVLCQRVPRLVRQPVTLAAWAATTRDVRPDGDPMFFVTMAEDMASATISVAAMHESVPHVEGADHRGGVDWVTDRLRELHERHPAAKFAAYAAGPVKAWVPTLAESYRRDDGVQLLGFELQLMSGTDASAACAHLEKLANHRAFTHSPDEVYTASLEGAEARALDGGSWTWDWRRSTGDLAPIAGATGALWLLEKFIAALPKIF